MLLFSRPTDGPTPELDELWIVSGRVEREAEWYYMTTPPMPLIGACKAMHDMHIELSLERHQLMLLNLGHYEVLMGNLPIADPQLSDNVGSAEQGRGKVCPFDGDA